jgi:hypothetical protein
VKSISNPFTQRFIIWVWTRGRAEKKLKGIYSFMVYRGDDPKGEPGLEGSISCFEWGIEKERGINNYALYSAIF